MLLEAREESDPSEIAERLESLGVKSFSILSGGWVSVELESAEIEEMRTLAHVHIKRRSRFHRQKPGAGTPLSDEKQDVDEGSTEDRGAQGELEPG